MGRTIAKKTHQLLAIKNSYEKGNNTESGFFVTLVNKTGSKLLQHFDVNNVEITCVRHVASLSIKG